MQSNGGVSEDEEAHVKPSLVEMSEFGYLIRRLEKSHAKVGILKAKIEELNTLIMAQDKRSLELMGKIKANKTYPHFFERDQDGKRGKGMNPSIPTLSRVADAVHVRIIEAIGEVKDAE